ncbi:acyltransferase [Halococcus salsus]|uniref:acyltransferase n=1 Tax=Halococcus salsus TaxID=2162894 RepID=UPI0013593C34|nr:acyltransferase [Halococcus salsus]
MPPNTVGTHTDILRRIGPLGLAKTVYYSKRTGNDPLSIILNSKAAVDLADSSDIEIDNVFFVGSIEPASSRAFSPTKLSVASDATIHAGGGLPRIGHGSVLRIEGDFSIGNSFVNSEFRLLCEDRIEIGDRCSIAWDVALSDTDRHSLFTDEETKPTTAPITINDNVWIGSGTRIKKGVVVGEGAVIASESVVTRDIPPKTLVAGAPARVIEEGVSWD